MSFINKCARFIAATAELKNDDYELMRYGLSILYINLSKTFLLLLCAAILNIEKEVLILFCSFSCVRASGFGAHSNSTVKCTIIGLIEFIGSTYIAILMDPLTLMSCTVLYAVSTIIFTVYAPVETQKRPISDLRKRIFKITSLVTATIMFIISLYIGETIYRNLIIIGILLESIIILPPVRQIII